MWLLTDTLRRLQGDALEVRGLGPTECRSRVLASSAYWRLREYAGGKAGPPLLIVAAPIKQPYIWDLAPSISAVRHCLLSGFRVYLLEWTPASGDRSAGLEDYAVRFIREAVAKVTKQSGVRPFLMGHSLGGTFAAIFAAFASPSVRGLVLLGTPLSFEPGSSRFRDALVTILPPFFSAAAVIPGAFLSQLVSVADPETFVWSRLLDAGLSMGHAWSAGVHARIERWALDELPLSGKLVQEILEWLYRENRFCGGTLSISNTTVGPTSIRVPTLAVVNDADAIAPPASVRPFIDAMPKGKTCLLQHTSEIGVGLPHFTILVGRQAHANVWPRIISWLHAHA